MERFYLRDTDYRELLTKYNLKTARNTLQRYLEPGWDDQIIEDIACDWMLNNFDHMLHWRPKGYINEKPKLWFAGIFPISDSSNGKYSSRTLMHGTVLE